MAAVISEKLGVKAKLQEGNNGVFEVVVNGVTIFSKHREGRYPDAAEIIAAIRKSA